MGQENRINGSSQSYERNSLSLSSSSYATSSLISNNHSIDDISSFDNGGVGAYQPHLNGTTAPATPLQSNSVVEENSPYLGTLNQQTNFLNFHYRTGNAASVIPESPPQLVAQQQLKLTMHDSPQSNSTFSIFHARSSSEQSGNSSRRGGSNSVTSNKLSFGLTSNSMVTSAANPFANFKRY